MNGIILGNRYELLEKIGEGGMSEVFKAKCNKLNRFVAVKILKKELANNEEISQKFKREATAIANLSDANIVNVLDVGTQDDIDYIVMEYINGKTLKDVIKFNGKLSYNTSIKIALQVAKALECAHKNNIIHRDIKPQNILVTESGEIKVTDFGIAKSADSSTITNTTSIIGSAHYLSPEQAKGTYIDCRADIYSFGIVLYEMVTGRLPFEGDSPVTIALKHLQETPKPPKELNLSLPDSLNKLILKCVEKEPIKRYQSAKEIILDLQKIQENPDVIIGQSESFDDQHTIVMSAISDDMEKTTFISKLQDDDFEDYDDEEDDDYDEDEEDEEEGFFKRKNKSEPKEGKRKNKKIVTIILSTILLLILGGVGYFFATSNITKEVKVPNIEGKKVEEAKKELEKLKLELEEIGTTKSDKPEGTIIEVNPKVGSTVKINSKIKVIISGGEEKIKMPDFRDYEVNNIRQYLELQEFTNFTILEEYNDNVPYGYLITQNPAAKTEVKKDSKIEIIISKGPEVKLVEVPNVIGMKELEGKGNLESLKLVVEVEKRTTNDKNQDGRIIDQSIVGSKVEEGTPVKIYVAQFEEKIIDVADLGLREGMTVLEAKSILKGAGLGVVYSGPQGDNDIVTSFTQTVKEGGTVTLTTKESKPSVEPPTESGDEEQSAQTGSLN
ncbi:Stk1 family PASTA domain-containing Ser/Thr kinase [Clostridium sp.]|uniref:Stk1 family PASTA domain-containing Ser/Thr kinase n=1 Tax=Clostridium sp. TaxID=1506 RepID=UPI003F3A6E74